MKVISFTENNYEETFLKKFQHQEDILPFILIIFVKK